MSLQNKFSMDRILCLLLGERRIALRWLVTMEVYEYSAAELPRPHLLKSVAEAAMDYATKRLPSALQVRWQVGVVDLITQSIFDAERFQAISPVSANLIISDQSAPLTQTAAKPYTWEVPGVIDLRGSTATISHTRVMNCFELNLFSGVGWQKVPADITPAKRTRIPLPLPAGILGD